MKRCVAYMRCSTDMQEYSIQNQRMQINTYAEAMNMTIVHEFEDPDRSGITVEKREGFQAMKALIEENNELISTILVLDVSRWGRFEDPDEAAYWEYHFKRMGIPVIYVNEEFKNDDSLADTMVKTLKRSMAGEFSKEQSKKVLQGSKTVASKGFSVGGIAPYGYDRMLVESDGSPIRILKSGEHKHEKTQRITFTSGAPDKVETVRRIFDMYANQEEGIRAIVEIFNVEQIPSPRGNKWTVGTISAILKNSVYIGKLTYNKNSNKRKRLKPGEIKEKHKKKSEWVTVNNAHEPLIPEEWFDKAQARRTIRPYHPNRDNSPYILRDVMVCMKCGAGFSGQSKSNGSGRRYCYYVDAGAERYGKSYCSRTSIRKDRLENFVLEKIHEQLQGEGVIENVRDRLREVMSDYEEKAMDEIKSIDKDIKQLDKEIHNLSENIRLHGPSKVLSDEITRIDAKRTALKSRKKLLLHGPTPALKLEAEIDEIVSGLENLKHMLRMGEFNGARKVINKVVPRIEIDSDKKTAKVYILNLSEKAKKSPENYSNGSNDPNGSSGDSENHSRAVAENMPEGGIEPP